MTPRESWLQWHSETGPTERVQFARVVGPGTSSSLGRYRMHRLGTSGRVTPFEDGTLLVEDDYGQSTFYAAGGWYSYDLIEKAVPVIRFEGDA